MGVRRLFLWAACALALLFGGLIPAGTAAASPIELAGAACAGGADSAEAAYNIATSQLDCGEDRFERHDRFVRARIELSKAGALPPGRLVWQTDPTSFDSMLIRLDYADGSQRLVDVDAQMAVRNWDANGNFWVSINQQASALSAIDVVVERPQTAAVFKRMALGSFDAVAARNYGRVLLYMLICGTLLVPIVYDLLFYRVLRARFMIWHLGMTAGTLLYVLFNTGLVMLLWSDIPSHLRFAAIWVVVALTNLCIAQFSIRVIEEGLVPRRVRRALSGATILSLAIACLTLFDIELLRMRIVDIFLISVVPVMGLLAAMLVLALRRRSRAAIFLTAAYAGLIVAGLVQVAASLGVIDLSEVIDESIYVALVILVLGTSAGVGDRFLVIKTERDRARMTAAKLGAMANSDGLTGLRNRRAFDQYRRLTKGRALLVMDIDRFKSINDTYGHQRGDAALCHAARVIEAAMADRHDCQIFRLGGEEFAVICPVADEAEMSAVAESLRRAMEQSGERDDGFDMPDLTISIGAVLGEGQLMHVAFAEADGALYRAKEGGRNRVEIAGSGPSAAY